MSFRRALPLVLTVSALFVSGQSAGDISAPAPAPTLKPGVVPRLAPALKLPRVLYPASGAAFEQTQYPHVPVYFAWAYDGNQDDVQGFTVCWWKDGSSCEATGTHIPRAADQRKATAAFFPQADTTSFKWKLGVRMKGSQTTTWSADYPITIYPRMELLKLLAPADGATVTLPGTIGATWEPMKNVDYFLYCNSRADNSNAWGCPDAPGKQGDFWFVEQVGKTQVGRAYPPNDISEVLGSLPSRSRTWGVAACRVVQEQNDADGGTAPVTVTRCKHSAVRYLTVKK